MIEEEEENLLEREHEEVSMTVEEFESDLEEEQMVTATVKPVFVLKSERDTITERENIEDEERAIDAFMKERVEEICKDMEG